MALGIYSIKLPVSELDLFKDVVQDTTIPVFSTYCPFRKSIIGDLNEMRINDRYKADDSSLISNEYQLPSLFPQQQCIGLNNIRPYIEYNGMMMTASYETIESYETLATGQALADLASTMIPPQTFEFVPPNTFRIYNQVLYNNKVWLDLLYTHSPELNTIPLSARESFFKLALLDMKIFIYNNLRQYMNIETAHGKVDLKIDEWSGAEGDKASMLEKWDDTYHFDKPSIFFI